MVLQSSLGLSERVGVKRSVEDRKGPGNFVGISTSLLSRVGILIEINYQLTLISSWITSNFKRVLRTSGVAGLG